MVSGRAELVEVEEGTLLVLSPEMLEHLNVGVGDPAVIETTEDGVLLSSEEQAERRAMDRVAGKYQDVLKRLADS